MAKILLAWELGANYGHVSRCLRIALALWERGHEVLFAVRDTRPATEILGQSGMPFVQAPLPIRPARLRRPPANYSELLLAEGYSDPLLLQGLLRGWLGLMQLHRVDVLLADHAPTALLAGQIAGVPALAVGNGFSIPPNVTPWPSIRPWEDIPAARLEYADRAVHATVIAACKGLGKVAPSWPEIFGANALLDTFPELDHYSNRAGGNYIGPICAPSQQKTDRAPAWNAIGGKKVLAYLRPGIAGFSALMAVLNANGTQTIAVIPGLPVAEAKRLAAPHLRIALRSIPLQHLLKSADVAISYGSGGFTAEALLAGKPMLLLPQFVEQYLGARQVEALGAGIVIGEDRTQENITTALERLLNESALKNAAQAFAARHADYRPADAIQRAVLALESMINRTDNHREPPLPVALNG